MKKIGLIIGSNRTGSFSSVVAMNVASHLKGKAEVVALEINDLPLYNQDFDAEGASPAAYTRFREALKGVDSVIVVTPEHNRSMPAVLKNALDVASRPWGQSVWSNKKAMIIGNSPGGLSGFGAATEVKRVLGFLNANIMQQPEVLLGAVYTLIDDKGVFVEATAKFVGSALDAFLAF